MEYAKELQMYYDARNVDVKVQIEANLAAMDDTDDRQYIEEAYNSYQRRIEDSKVLSETASDKMKVQRLNIRKAYTSHFRKNDPVQLRPLKGIQKKNEEPIEKLLQGTKKQPIEYDKLTQGQVAELRKAQEQIY